MRVKPEVPESAVPELLTLATLPEWLAVQTFPEESMAMPEVPIPALVKPLAPERREPEEDYSVRMPVVAIQAFPLPSMAMAEPSWEVGMVPLARMAPPGFATLS